MSATPEHFSAQSVITDAFTDINVLSPGETLSADYVQDGLRRLKRFVSQLRTQGFTAPFISREVFPITANQSLYTIGPGGDFDTQRPQAIQGAGLLLTPTTGSFAITGVSPASRTFTVAGDQTGSFPSGSDFTVSGSTGNNGSYTIVSASYTSATTITVADTIPDSTADGTIRVFGDANATVEIPIGILTDDAYQAIQVKGMGNTQWTQLYYNPTYAGGLGSVWLWPKPSTAANACVLYLQPFVAEFAALTTEYWFPPGYADLFEYGLANRLLGPYAVSDADIKSEIKQQFATALTLVKRSNIPRNDMPIDAALFDGSGGTLFNILTGNG